MCGPFVYCFIAARWYNQTMELYAYEIHEADFTPPDNNSLVTATVSVNGGTPVDADVTVDGTKRTITLPYLDGDGNAEVAWSYSVAGNDYVRKFNYEIVTPYLSIADVKSVVPEATDAQAIDIESGVRHLINAHTGQSFGGGVKTLTVEGNGEDGLHLPERLRAISGLSSLTAQLNTAGVIITSDGWYIKKKWLDELSSIETTQEYWGDSRYGGVIVVPTADTRPQEWRRNYPFQITGLWGYDHVPEPVVQAARLLVADYSCMEAKYRDSYLESIKAADWRMQFNARSWENTGNVRADQLLSQYVLLNWLVI